MRRFVSGDTNHTVQFSCDQQLFCLFTFIYWSFMSFLCTCVSQCCCVSGTIQVKHWSHGISPVKTTKHNMTMNWYQHVSDSQPGESEQQSARNTRSQSAERPETSPDDGQNLDCSPQTAGAHSSQQQAQPACRRQEVCECVSDVFRPGSDSAVLLKRYIHLSRMYYETNEYKERRFRPSVVSLQQRIHFSIWLLKKGWVGCINLSQLALTYKQHS